MSRVRYADLTPRLFRERIAEAPIAYLPLGTLEWHGEHLPLGADGLQSGLFFEQLAEEVGGIVLPMLFVGPDIREMHGERDLIGMDVFGFPEGEGRQLDGSAYWISDDLYRALIERILEQLARAGFKIVVAHGHGPSTTQFQKGAEEWAARFGLRLLTCRDAEADKRGTGVQSDHAAANETSLCLNLCADLVEMQNLDPDPAVKPVAVDGQDPRTHASASRGEKIVAAQLKRLAHMLRQALQAL